MAMNPGQDANPESPAADAPEIDPDTDADVDADSEPEIASESLQRSRDAIDEGREAAREALKDEDGWTSGAAEEPTSAEGDARGESQEEPER